MLISTHVVGPVFTNCYVLTDEGTGETAVIDPGELTPELLEQLEKIGRDRIKYILLTHCHFDHMLGAAQVKELTGAPVAIFRADAELVSDPSRNGMDSFGITNGRMTKADTLLDDGDRLSLGDLNIKVIHTPGHTIGSCCYICEDVIFSGDTLFAQSCGRTDLPTGSFAAITKSLGRLAALEGDYRVYPGHNSSTTLAYEREYNQYMK